MSVSRVIVSVGALALLAGRIWAQQPATPSGAVAGNVEHGRYLVERVVMCYGAIRRATRRDIITGAFRRADADASILPGDWPR